MTHNNGRRHFLKTAAIAAGAFASTDALATELLFDTQKSKDASLSNSLDVNSLATDERYWQRVANHYRLTGKVTNLENGYWGVMSKPVLEAYQRNTTFVNEHNTYFARREWWNNFMQIHQVVADFLGVNNKEVALTRGATEALQSLITGYNKLKPGDKVLYADLDYSEMKTAMRWLEERRGVEVIKIDFPEPATHENVVELYRDTLKLHPEIKLMLLTHLNNWTGLIAPVKEISKMAKTRGIDIILDAAHSVGQVDFAINELGCDFVGVNLHKWVGAPIGCGVMYIKQSRVKDIDSYLGKAKDSPNILDRIDTGTANFAAYMTIPNAITFHQQIGTSAKQHRLKYLRDLWVDEVSSLKHVQVLTPNDPEQVAALTSFRLHDERTTEGNNLIAKRLAEQYGVLTVRRTGPALGDCIRVTPSIYNTVDDMKRLVKALHHMANA